MLSIQLNNIKKCIVLIILLLILCFNTSCMFKHIPDTNGEDDYSLVTITDNDFIKGMGSLSSVSVTNNKKDMTSVKVRTFSGVSNLKTLKPKGKTIQITTNFIVNSGNARLVLMKGKEIIYDFKLNMEDTYIISLSEDTYDIRLGGESANIELKITYN